jgi:hypothetical protein
VSQHEHGDRSIHRMEMDPRGPVRRVELEDRSSLVVIEWRGRRTAVEPPPSRRPPQQPPTRS